MLYDAVFQQRPGQEKPGPRVRLDLDLVSKQGKWQEDVYGWSWNLNRAEHYGRLRGVKVEGDRFLLDLLVEIDGDESFPGGLAEYAVDVRFDKSKATGTYKGKFRNVEVSGKVEGDVAALPKPRDGFVPPEPGEHPRLLFRAADLPALKKKAETEWGRKLVEAMKAATDDGLAMGVLYNLTGEQKYADRCREILTKERQDFSGGPFDTGHAHGPRQQRMALVYDLAYHGLEERFRSMIAGYLAYYTSRGTLRPSALAEKPNLLPGSDTMALLVAGTMTSQAALWDAPGAFPPEPVPPRMEKVDPPKDFAPGAGVPVVKLEPGKAVEAWLFAGPFFAYPDREDSLVLAPRRRKPKAGPFYQHLGQDFLASVGGPAAARPAAGTKVDYRGRSKAFGPLAAKALVEKGGAKVIDVWAAHENVPCSTGYYYTILESPAAGWFVIRLAPPDPEAAGANTYLGDQYPDFIKQVPYRPDATAYLNGQAMTDGDAVRLDAGRYPLMIRATTRQYRLHLRPRFEPTTEEKAREDLAARQAQFDQEIEPWETLFESYYRRPLYRICERKAWRYDLWGQGDGGYPNESGAYHDFTMPVANVLAHVYRNVTGVALPHIGMNLPCGVVRESGNDSRFAAGFATVPEPYKPAVLWAWKQAPDFGRSAVFNFLNFPPEMEAKNPQGILPSPYVDRQQGYYHFRNGWKGDETVAASVFFKSFAVTGWNRPNAGSFDIRGFGRTWAWRGDERSGDRYLDENVVQFPGDPVAVNDLWDVGPGRVVHFEGRPDGSGVVSAALDDVLLGVKLDDAGTALAPRDAGGEMIRDHLRDLGLRNLRSFAADYGGAAGAPGLFVVVDKTVGGKGKYWQLLPGVGDDPAREVKIEGRTFTVREGDVSLVGTFAAPADVKITLVEPDTRLDVVGADGKAKSLTVKRLALRAEGGDDFFVVMTLQKGAPPPVKIEGSGLGAKVTVGQCTVVFDGTKIVVGK